ncbi:PREDICTED: uncharacterized protein LOC106539352 [Thamnophis sirtalis]|uniref:Uncharacterized protein LOC106539352 n=1 Tax=Thamnophis sirtalis TaxID=35019 RepID=A0A6I9XEW6_9SAUR|nr:PREDICTED: uncharacterized protein LOC106539352 [Thamnophis sirtalis]
MAEQNATDIQGESIEECTHNCFETCIKQFIECSKLPRNSSFNLNQVPCHCNFCCKEKKQTKLEFEKDNTFISLRSPHKMENISGGKLSEEIKENDFEVLGSPALLVESGEEGEKSCAKQFSKSKGFSSGKEMEELCIEEPASKQIKRSSATLKPEEECEFLIEEYLSSAPWFSISGKKQKLPKRTTSASFEGSQEAKQHNKIKKNKRELKKTVMPIPLQEINTTLCNVGERCFDGFQNASRIKQVIAVENNKSQLVMPFVTSQETRKQIHSKNNYKNSGEMHNTSYPKSKKRAKGRIPLLEADEKLSVQIQPLEITKQSLSRNKLTTLRKVQYEKQEDSGVMP